MFLIQFGNETLNSTYIYIHTHKTKNIITVNPDFTIDDPVRMQICYPVINIDKSNKKAQE